MGVHKDPTLLPQEVFDPHMNGVRQRARRIQVILTFLKGMKNLPELVARWNEKSHSTEKAFNGADFFRDFVRPSNPLVPLQIWRAYTRAFKRAEDGVLQIPSTYSVQMPKKEKPDEPPIPDTPPLDNSFLAKDDRFIAAGKLTEEGIVSMLRIGLRALQEVEKNPKLMPIKDRLELLVRAMRAQDSRIGAMTQVRAAEQAVQRFQKNFSNAAYSIGGLEGGPTPELEVKEVEEYTPEMSKPGPRPSEKVDDDIEETDDSYVPGPPTADAPALEV